MSVKDITPEKIIALLEASDPDIVVRVRQLTIEDGYSAFGVHIWTKPDIEESDPDGEDDGRIVVTVEP